MDRRTFIGAIAGGLVAARSAAEDQFATTVSRVGFLLGATRESVESYFTGFMKGWVISDTSRVAMSSSSSGTREDGWSDCLSLRRSSCGCEWT